MFLLEKRPLEVRWFRRRPYLMFLVSKCKVFDKSNIEFFKEYALNCGIFTPKQSGLVNIHMG